MKFHSSSGYEFVRRTFNQHLPEESTIRKWYTQSNLNAEPGITAASIEYLKSKVAAKQYLSSELVCALSFDEMFIRQQTIFDPNLGQMIGYVTYGQTDLKEKPIATKSLVFMVCGLNEKIRIPVAYHFVNSLNASDKTDLLENVLNALLEIGVKITSVTFDGDPVHKKMCEKLGANLDIFSEHFQPYFVFGGKKISIFYDICHNEKLIRGQLDKKKILIDQNGDEVKWSYIQNLVRYTKEMEFIGTHKLKQAHLDWRRRPMNVRIAIETLSKSTANSIEFLRLKNYPEFIDAEPTENFIRLFDTLFDIYNTKIHHSNENLFKNALDVKNKDAIYALFSKATDYIKELKLNRNERIKKICETNAKTGFVGFVINMYSLKLIYTEFVENLKLLEFIPTYYLNQDAVEMFFGKIRALGGFNDNPNVVQFQSAYRKLLANDSIFLSRKGNCQVSEMDSNPFSDILFVSSRRDKTNEISDIDDEIVVLQEFDELSKKLDDLHASTSSSLTDELKNYSIAHIASIVESKLKSLDDCIDCIKVFDDCEKVNESFFVSKSIRKPCLSTYKICKEVDAFLKLQVLKGDINFRTIYYSILNNIDVEHMYKESNFVRHPTHKVYLIRAVVDGYIRMKGVYLATRATEDIHKRKIRFKFRSSNKCSTLERFKTR